MQSGPSDPLAWAKSPASDTAAQAVIDLAKKDRRFATIARVLIEDGIINERGYLLVDRNGVPVKRAKS